MGSLIQATDFDGDTAPGGAVQIVVNDDTPMRPPGRRPGRVDEDGVVDGIADAGPGDGIAGGTGDVAGEAVASTGSVTGLFQSGADEPLTYGFAANAVIDCRRRWVSTSGERCAELCDCCDTGDGVCAGWPHGVHAGAARTRRRWTGRWFTFTLVDQLDHARWATLRTICPSILASIVRGDRL